ncbi:MAG: VIT1/CCC1 transporter family protein [Chloroflexi bacterium]|nr:VIT1/CCC1 transporter family protein [Chloroflexota bacterium]
MTDNSKYWIANWQREIEGSYLYKGLTPYAHTPQIKKALSQMADQEISHAVVWEERIHEINPAARKPRIDLRIHLTLLVGRMFGAEAVLPLLLNDEVSDIASYSDQAMTIGDKETYQRVLKDEATHARTLASLSHPDQPQTQEPWHRTAKAGGMLRNMVYGFNDGLTANFGLVMGVIGAAANNRVLLLTGFAGLLADALSMAASGFLAARSEQEVRQYHLSLEKAELELIPQEEKEELAGYFTNKGLTRQEAMTVANRLMEKPEVALTQLAREELGIDPEAPSNPLQEGVVTGIATGLGAVIPILPFIVISGVAAIWAGVAISMVAHFMVGASRAIFTGRPAIRSGFEMFVVGMGVALVTYLLGLLIGVRL